MAGHLSEDTDAKMRFLKIICLMCLFSMACAALAQEQTPLAEQPSLLSPSIPAPPIPAGFWARQQLQVAVCTAPPKIDGTIDDACWQGATHAAGFYRYFGTTPIVNQTEAWICADKTHLYLAFHCLDSQPSLIRAGEIQRNGQIYNDDYVQVDIDSQNSHRSFSTFQVTARGTQAETIEGGTADNITWAGDWKAATRRVKDGWTCEMSIPFALLRYPRGTHAMSLLLSRKIARETTLECWPYLPPEGNQNEAEYLNEFVGIAPPVYTPRPVFLPYILATGGEGNSIREGLDIKYPLTTTLTAVAALFPDFRTVEQDVTTINFSYTEKFVSDRRPFFAEGSGYLPSRELFYSQRIGTVDEGVKVVGKQGNTTLGLLGTTSHGADGQSDYVVSARQDIGLFSKLSLDLVGDSPQGQPFNQVAKLEGTYGWQQNRTQYSFTANRAPSWLNGQLQGSKTFAVFNINSPAGRPGLMIDYDSLPSNFISNLGFLPDTDYRGYDITLSQFNQFDKGPVEQYYVEIDGNYYQHNQGGFFHDGISPFAYVGLRSGLSFNSGFSLSQRDQFHDRTGNLGVGWGGKTQYQQGNISDAFGRQADQPYNFLSLSQGLFISRPFSLNLNYNRLLLGSDVSTQSVVTGTYRLSPERAIGGRLVAQDGNADLYLSFAQQARSGADLFLLLGDPNSPRTRGTVTMKVVYPF